MTITEEVTEEVTPVEELPTKRGPGRPPGFKGQSNRIINYKCGTCDIAPGRDELFAMRVSFTTIGKPLRIVKSRTVGWLCRRCMESQPAWKKEAYMDSPGLQDVRESDGS